MSSDHLTADAATLAAARDGDLDALASVWRIYQPQLLRFLRARRCPAPDDVSSQVWIDVGRSFAEFDGDGRAFQRWIFTIARNRSIDELRRVQRRAEASLDHGEGREPRAAIGADPAADIGSLDWALAQINRLPTDQAEAVMLRVVADLSVTEVAMVMGYSENNVRVLVHRGLNKLRSLLAAQEPTPDETADLGAGLDGDLDGDSIGPEEIRESCNAEPPSIVSRA